MLVALNVWRFLAIPPPGRFNYLHVRWSPLTHLIDSRASAEIKPSAVVARESLVDSSPGATRTLRRPDNSTAWHDPRRMTAPPRTALEVAHIVKAIMVDRFAARCSDRVAGRVWYVRNIDVWDDAQLATHAPDESVRRAGAAVVLEGHPDGERPPADCWGVEISTDNDVLAAIPGWHLECWACWLVYPQRSPTPEQVRTIHD